MAGLILAILSGCFSLIFPPRWPGWQEIFLTVMYWTLIYSVCSGLVMFVFGLPLYLVYRRLGWQSQSAFAMGGTAIGCGSFLLLSLTGEPKSGLLPGVALFSLGGLLSALAFRALLPGGSKGHA